MDFYLNIENFDENANKDFKKNLIENINKEIDENYKRDGNFTNIYMIIECMKILLDKDKFKEFENLFSEEVGKLKENLHSININDILRIMGFNV